MAQSEVPMGEATNFTETNSISEKPRWSNGFVSIHATVSLNPSQETVTHRPPVCLTTSPTGTRAFSVHKSMDIDLSMGLTAGRQIYDLRCSQNSLTAPPGSSIHAFAHGFTLIPCRFWSWGQCQALSP